MSMNVCACIYIFMESEESGHQRGVNEDDMGLYMHPRTLG
jgi:hypothetical protein